MNPESGMIYELTFGLLKRNEASRFAYDLAKKAGLSRKKALVKSARAFLGRRVSIPGKQLTQPEGSALKAKVNVLAEKKIVSRIATQSGFDLVRTRGKSREEAKKIIVRTWPYKSIDYPGHAALSVKNALKAKKERIYFSFWPSSDPAPKTLLNRLINIIDSDYAKKPAYLARSYRADKLSEIGPKTQARLMTGAGKFSYLVKHFEAFKKVVGETSLTPEQLPAIKDKPLAPRTRQSRLKKSVYWGMKADKVFIPVFGANQNLQSKESTFNLFGLNEQKMEAFYRQVTKEVDDQTRNFQLVSGTSNCTALVLDALKQGGAEHFTKTNDAWLVSDPNIGHMVAVRLQERIDALNSSADTISARFNHVLERPEFAHCLNTETQLPDFRKILKVHTGLTLNDHGRLDRALHRAIIALQKTPSSTDALMPKTIILVETLDKALSGASDKEVLRLLPALVAFEHTRQRFKNACEKEALMAAPGLKQRPLTQG